MVGTPASSPFATMFAGAMSRHASATKQAAGRAWPAISAATTPVIAAGRASAIEYRGRSVSAGVRLPV